MQRIVIVGIGGKSTLAAKLGERTNLPVYHLDKYYWLANWQERDREEMKKIVDKIVARNKWIIEGNFGMHDSWIDGRLSKADAIIFLNYPFYRVVLPRVLQRRWQYRGKTRPDIADNNREKLNWDFLKYLKSYDRKSMIEKLEPYKNQSQVFVFTKTKQAEDFLNGAD